MSPISFPKGLAFLAMSLAHSEGSTVSCRVSAWKAMSADGAQLARSRKSPGSYQGKDIPASLLKNADDHTVAALAAVLDLVAENGWQERSFRDWGVIAAPVIFGRFGLAQALDCFRKEGAWGVSPHVIPNHSLHAVSGTISLTLQMQGPNFGIGGGAGAFNEAFLVAAGMMSDQSLPGLFVVLTAMDPEYIPADGQGGDAARPFTCFAAAFALESGAASSGELQLKIAAGTNDASRPLLSMPEFVSAWEKGPALGAWNLAGHGSISFSRS